MQGKGKWESGVGLTWGSGREVYKGSEREKGLKNHQGCLIDEYNIDILNKIIPPKNHRLFNKNSSTRHEKPVKLLVQGIQETPKTIEPIAIFTLVASWKFKPNPYC